jgi:hypothetical protein
MDGRHPDTETDPHSLIAGLPAIGMVVATADPSGAVVAPTPVVNGFDDAQADRFARSFNPPIVGSAATQRGGGYWLVASDGRVVSFGDARFYGSIGGSTAVEPTVAWFETPETDGYRLITA